ncbi:unnamed protein product [Adineta steineri]|nr:unnamed protein product [Adineta steineri]
MVSAALSMCMAGTVEIFRQNICKTQNFTQIIADKEYIAANMSVFFQFPQYVGIGLSEVFTSVASLEFAYLAAPQSAQSLIMSLRFCSAGLSSFFGSGIVGLLSIVNGNQIFENYRNDERYYIYFFILAGFQLVFILIFIGCNRKYKILKLPNHHHLSSRHFLTSNSNPITD